MLSSAEVGTLITALGCGIGSEEHDPAKLRYHRIIIMTDADVDGSHIRTLLLTFFYRQMPELIEKDHIYIAQPPLYKVKRGKQERYVKDDAELDGFLMEMALDQARIELSDGATLQSESLRSVSRDYLSLRAITKRLSRRIFPEVLEAMKHMPLLDGAEFESRGALNAWFERLEESLRGDSGLPASFTVELEDRPDDGFRARLQAVIHGVESERVVGSEFFRSAEYRNLVRLSEHLYGDSGSVAAVRGERMHTAGSIGEGLEWLLNEARRGLHVQRYKGLGEMNPEQLWETTMDPGSRRLLRVKIEDGVAADELFTTLMGDQVGPRRDFIESNALAVANLDT